MYVAVYRMHELVSLALQGRSGGMPQFLLVRY
jgi:hypothetical protein